jgi:hypothetical protein
MSLAPGSGLIFPIASSRCAFMPAANGVMDRDDFDDFVASASATRSAS